jgi:hypothetical protein
VVVLFSAEGQTVGLMQNPSEQFVFGQPAGIALDKCKSSLLNKFY